MHHEYLRCIENYLTPGVPHELHCGAHSPLTLSWWGRG